MTQTAEACIAGAPRLSAAHLTRQRLFTALDAEAPLTIVRASSGSGKTALLADWAHRRVGRHGAWVGLSEFDATRREFWATVAGALVSPGLGDAAAALAELARRSPGPSSTPAEEAAYRRDLSRVFSGLPAPFVLVLDDLHRVADALVHHDLGMILRSCTGLSLVAATAIRCPLDDPLVQLDVDCRHLLGDDLAFTRTELDDFLDRDAEVNGRPALLDTAAVDALHRRLRGHLLRTRLAIVGIRREGRMPTGPAAVERVCDDVLRATVRPLVDRDDVDVVLRCAVPGRLTAELVTELAPEADAETLLASLESSGVAQWDRSADVLVVDAAVREVLRREIRDRDPSRWRRLQRAVARWEFLQGDPSRALRHALASGDLALVSEVVMHRWHELVVSSDLAGQAAALLEIEPHDLRRHPFIAALCAHSLERGGQHARARTQRHTAVAALRLRRRRSDGVERFMIDLALSELLREGGVNDVALQSAREIAQRITTPDPELADMGGTLPAAAVDVALTFFRTGCLDEACVLLSEEGMSRIFPGMSRLPVADVFMAAICAHLGDMRGATRYLQRVRASSLITPELRILHQYARAWVHLERFDLAGARRAVAEARADASMTQLRCYVEIAEAYTAFGSDRAHAGLVQLERFAEDAVQQRRLLRAEIMVIQGTIGLLRLSAMQIGSARRIVARHDGTAANQMFRAVIELSAGRTENVISLLVASARQPGSPRVEVSRDLLYAAALLRQGKRIEAGGTMAQMMTKMTQYGLRGHLTLIPKADLRALRDLLEERSPGLARALGDIERIPELIHPAQSIEPLSQRESIVLDGLASGATVRELAERLCVSTNTVKTQLRSVYRKLDVRSREEALAVALREGLLDPPR